MNESRRNPKAETEKELPEGPSILWLTILVLGNILIFGSFSYAVWSSLE